MLPVWSPGAEKGLGRLCGRREVAVETRSIVIEKTEHEIHYFSLKSGWGGLGTCCNSEVESRTRNLYLLFKNLGSGLGNKHFFFLNRRYYL